MTTVKELIEKTGGEVNVLVKSAPKAPFMNWNYGDDGEDDDDYDDYDDDYWDGSD
jgi:hypothetical protein